MAKVNHGLQLEQPDQTSTAFSLLSAYNQPIPPDCRRLTLKVRLKVRIRNSAIFTAAEHLRTLCLQS
jgi:hypothetical protein